MSLILDALRKSEAERRRGRMPDLHAELPPLVHATAPRRRAWPWWFAGLVVLMAAAALAWSQWASRTATDTTPPHAIDGVGPVEAAGSAATAQAIAPPVSAPLAPAAASRASQAEPAPPPPPLAEQHVVREAAPSTPTDTKPPVAATGEAAVSTPPPPVSRQGPAIETASLPAPAQPSTPAIPITPATSDAVRVADLTPGEREQLPALKISMHMWGPTPAQRFAIIDGTRVGQGDRVGDAVVEEIATDGVVLNWHGRRLSLPLR